MLEALHIDPGGEGYLPYAQGLLRALKATLNGMKLNSGRRNFITPDGNGSIIVRTRRGRPGAAREVAFSQDSSPDSWYDSIKIETGCTDRRGFMLVRDNAFERAPYQAYYVDGVIERIQPTEGELISPVPEVRRSKGYKIPGELSNNDYTRVASLYSGLIREAAGCYHGGGKNAPFSYTWACTHGIVKKTIADPEPHDAYWLIEVHSGGVYAAPIKVTGKCCDSWGVKQYMPTSAQVEENSNLRAYAEIVSLQWAYAGRPNSGVVQLLTHDDMAAVYASYGPWHDGCGWAFSYSGHEAANVVAKQVRISGHVGYYETFLATLSFVLTPEGGLSASLARGPLSQITFAAGAATLWVPSGENIVTWDAIEPFIGEDGSGPIHVYYDGDEQKLTNWSLTNTHFDEEVTPPIVDSVGTTFWNGNGTGTHIRGQDPAVNVHGCQHPSGIVFNYRPLENTGGFRNSAYDRATFGFTGLAGGANVEVIINQLREASETVLGSESVASHTDYHAIDLYPGCYYYGQTGLDHSSDPPPDHPEAYQLPSGIWEWPTYGNVNSIQIVYRVDDTWAIAQRQDEAVRRTSSGQSHLILFPMEREAVALIREQSHSISTTTSFGSPTSFKVRQAQTAVSGQWPDQVGHFTNWDVPAVQFGGSTGSPPPSTTIDTGDGSGSFAVAAAGEFFFGSSWGLDAQGFLERPQYVKDFYITTEHVQANSSLFTMRGNLWDVDATLVPPDQKANRVSVVDALYVNGGFATPPDQVVAFVGRA